MRLYDFFLACHPLMPIYFAAVIVLYREQEVLDCDCDMASVHHLLSQIPQDLPYETLISRAGDLFVQFPPSELARKAAAQQQAEKTAASTSKTLSWHQPSRGLTWCCDSGFGAHAL